MDFMDLLAGWNKMKPWQKTIGAIFVAIIIINTSFDLARNIGVIPSRDNTVRVELSEDLISNTTHFVDDELLLSPNQTLILAHAPNPPSSLKLNWYGFVPVQGEHYTLSGNIITLLAEKMPEEKIYASYRY